MLCIMKFGMAGKKAKKKHERNMVGAECDERVNWGDGARVHSYGFFEKFPQ